MKSKRIVFCTLRDNRGATGGPGGVLYLQKKFLGCQPTGIPCKCKYQFNIIPRGLGIFKSKINKMLFYLKFGMMRNTYFFAHDIDTAYLLAKLRKRYSLLFHQQGPVVQELLNFEHKIAPSKIKKIQTIEHIALTHAETLHFPSNGASKMYFDSAYASCKQKEVNLSFPLYNTIPEVKSVIQGGDVGVKEDKSSLTFFSLGTLTSAKGQDLTVEFLKKFVIEYQKPIRYILVGKGPLKELLLDKLENMKREFSHFSYVYLESIPHEVVMYLHHISDVYIMLHRISIFDFATLEAMSQGSAIILSKVGGNIDFNKENNILFAEDTLTNLSSITKTAIENYKVKNLQVFQRYFSHKAFVEQYQKLFKMIL